MIDRVAAQARPPAATRCRSGFKWFVDGLLDGSLGFGGEESAGASFLRRDGTVWTTDKDGIVAGAARGGDHRRAGPRSRRALPRADARVRRAGATSASTRRRRRRRKQLLAKLSPRARQRDRAGRRADQRDPHQRARQRRADRRPQGDRRRTAGSPRGRRAPRTSTRSTPRASAARSICGASRPRRRRSSARPSPPREPTSTRMTQDPHVALKQAAAERRGRVRTVRHGGRPRHRQHRDLRHAADRRAAARRHAARRRRLRRPREPPGTRRARSASRCSTDDLPNDLDLTIDGADEVDPELEPDQGRRRRAAAREDRRAGQPARDHRRRREQALAACWARAGRCRSR